MLYKRLFNHRPIIQNEVHYFVREFEVSKLTDFSAGLVLIPLCIQTKHGEDSDLKTLQDTMSKSDEINTVFLNEIACSMPHFKKIKEKCETHTWCKVWSYNEVPILQPALSEIPVKNC